MRKKVDFTDKDVLMSVEGLARDGYCDKDIAAYYGYCVTYFSELTGIHSELSEALKRGRKPLNLAVENALLKRATGMKVKTVVSRYIIESDGTETDRQIVQETESEIPPDTGAAAFWLKQRKPDVWNKQPTKIENTSISAEDSEILKKELEEIKKIVENE